MSTDTAAAVATAPHFLCVDDWDRARLADALNLAQTLKAEAHRGVVRRSHAGQSVALVFHKPSLRTRVSFEVALAQLGAKGIYLTDGEIGINSREPVQDVGRVLARYVDAIVIRTFAHQNVVDLARWSSVPVINALTDLSHPCQILGDLLTVVESGFALDGLKVAFIGDGNNVANSWVEASARFALDLRIACPAGDQPDEATLARARAAGAAVRVVHDPREAADGAQVLYTDVWASMGQEAEKAARAQRFQGFTIDNALLGVAAPDAVVMHCLPAHRGEEITDEVMEGPQSVVFNQAENRLHVQRAVLAMVMAPTAT